MAIIRTPVTDPFSTINEQTENADRYGGWACFDAAKEMLSREEMIGALRFTIHRYLWRYKDKGGVQDLKKAKVYLDKLIEAEVSEISQPLYKTAVE